jgi:Zinc carboxypeptidase
MRRLAALLLGAALPVAAAGSPPNPSAFLGLSLGADRTLADWTQAVAYLRALGDASPRVVVEDVGPTTEGRPFLVVTISSEKNIAHLESIRAANLRLADPRGLTDAEADRLVAEGKTIVSLNHGIHSDEMASSQSALETAYWLSTANDDATRRILDSTVVVMVPCQNPDGMQRVTEWYRRTLGTPFEGADPPFLYHHYTGHDDNRDWYMFTQVETRLTVEHVYERWRPQIVHDLHQMEPEAARIFLPPYLDPWEPNVDPALRAMTNALGSHVAATLVAEGRPGVVTHAIYDAWSPSRSYPTSHGGVRLLSECASPRLATPIDVPFVDLAAGPGYDPRVASWNFPLPWPGGHWRLRDVMDYQRSATRAVLEHAAAHRELWLRNFLEVNRRAVTRREPFAFVVPREQRDPVAAARLRRVLRTAGVEVHRATAAFDTKAGPFAAGSYVVFMTQPASAFAKMVLEAQRYPDLRKYPGGPPQRPYDATAHTLPLLMGVDVRQVGEPFDATLERAGDADEVAPGGVEGRGRLFALGHATGDMIILGRLLREGIAVRWALEPFADRGRRFEAGSLLVPASAHALLQRAALQLGLQPQAIDCSPRALVLRKPRLAVYQSAIPVMDEGWTRFVLEHDVDVDYATVRDGDLLRPGIATRFDAILLPDQSPKGIVEGHAPGTLPEELTGGLGQAGVRNLEAFVRSGGTLIALNAAARLPVEDFDLGVRNVLPHASGDQEVAGGVYAPGAILRASIDATRPLGHGLGPTAALWFDGAAAFEGGTAVATYRDTNPLLSGWLLGGENLEGKSALVEAPLGRGRVVLFGFRPQYRAQSWGTYVALLNAIYLSAARPAP